MQSLRYRSPLLAFLAVIALALTAGCGGDREPKEDSEGVLRYGAPSDDSVDWGEKAEGIEIGKADAVGPKKAPKKTPRKTTKKTTKKVKKAGKYTVVEVANGGTIKGKVTFASRPEIWTVEYNKDQEQCKHESFPTERVIFDEQTLGVANCVVYLADITKGKDWEGEFAKGEDERVALLDQIECRYVPHVQVMRPMSQLQIKNSDPAEHNVHAYYRDFKTTQFNQMTGANSFWPEIGAAYLEKAGTYIMKCDVHAWMSGYVLVLPNPYFAVTKKDGVFELSNVPPGKYVLLCWHEGMKEVPQLGSGGISGYDYGPPVEKTQDVSVEAGKVVEANFTLEAPPKSGQ